MPRKDRENTLAARWSKRDNDILFEFPRKCDGSLLSFYFGHLRPHRLLPADPEPKTLLEELEDRGYDTTTLRFSIKRKKPAPAEAP